MSGWPVDYSNCKRMPLSPFEWAIYSLVGMFVGSTAGVLLFGRIGLLGAIPGLFAAWVACSAYSK